MNQVNGKQIHEKIKLGNKLEQSGRNMSLMLRSISWLPIAQSSNRLPVAHSPKNPSVQNRKKT